MDQEFKIDDKKEKVLKAFLDKLNLKKEEWQLKIIGVEMLLCGRDTKNKLNKEKRRAFNSVCEIFFKAGCWYGKTFPNSVKEEKNGKEN